MMMLAEALRERADAPRRLAGLRDRIAPSARYTEGEDPAADATALLADADAVIDRMADLIARINRTNLTATLPDGRTLTAALAQRDALRCARASPCILPACWTSTPAICGADYRIRRRRTTGPRRVAEQGRGPQSRTHITQ